MNRNQFDTLRPSDALWNKIDMSFTQSVVVKSNYSWLKYFVFGASMIAIVVYLKMSSTSTQVTSELPKQETLISSAVPKDTLETSPASEVNPIVKGMLFQQSSLPAEQIATEEVTCGEVGYMEYTESNELEEGSEELNGDGSGSEFTPTNVINASSKQNSNFTVDTMFQGVKTLEIISNTFDVDIKTNQGNQVFFKANVITVNKGIVKGKTIYNTIYERKDSTLIININSSCNTIVIGSSKVKNPNLYFDVPEHTNVIVTNAYGNVSANGLKGAVCNLQAKSGNMNVENIEANTKLIANYGDVTVANIKGNLTALVKSGDLSVTTVLGNLDIKSTYGSQVLADIHGNINISSTSGNVKIRKLQGNIELYAVYGDVHLEDCIGNLNIQATSGDVKGENIELIERMNTTSIYGSVDIQLVNELNSLSFDLKTTYGDITIDKNGQHLREANSLVLNNGKITVKGITTSGDQYYK
ncbi:MAG: DUF4097 family beta strand repeat protein [Bacteroidetes bacterium]|nr:DUF4097 family beta strand repeat protein [Bacteroidota bacterium]